MNVIDRLNDYSAVSTYLEDNVGYSLFQVLKEKIQNKEYVLPFIGQFSSGKSKLINRIIGRNLLPTKTVETTAFVTYIKYGESEQAILEYADNGEKVNIPLTEIVNLHHDSLKDKRSVESLTIYLPLQILQNGLILADTPGVNSLINKHIEITENLLMNSQYVVYVYKSSLTDSDKEMIQKIDSLQIPLLFARTHVDCINSNEENVRDTLVNDKALIEKCIGRSIDNFNLCNDDTKDSFIEYIPEYDDFISYITEGLSENLDAVYADSINRRLDIYKERYLNILSQKRDSVVLSANMSSEVLQKQLDELEQQENNLQRKLDGIKKQCQSSIESSVTDVCYLLDNCVRSEKDKFSDLLSGKDIWDKPSAESLFHNQMSGSIDAIGKKTSAFVTTWVGGYLKDVDDVVSALNQSLKSVDLEYEVSFDETTVTDYAEKEESLMADFQEKYSELQYAMKLSEDELNQLGLKREELSALMNQYDEIVSKQNEELREIITSYQPQYVVKQSKLAPKMKIVGQIADVACLFIPAAGWEKAGTMLAAKSATIAAKGGKTAKAVSETMKVMGKGAMLMAEADKTLDTAKMVDAGIKGAEQLIGKGDGNNLPTKKEKHNIFDYLSLSFLFEKMGEYIDPTTTELDENYEKQYNIILSQKQEEVEKIVADKLNTMRQNGQLKTKIEEIRKRRELEQESTEKLKDELKNVRMKIEIDKQKEISAIISSQAVSQYQKVLSGYAEFLKQQCREQLALISEDILEAASESVSSQMNVIKENISEILSTRQSDNDSYDELILEIEQQIDLLK